MESYGQTNYIFSSFIFWVFMSLQELNLCINYTSELNEGAGAPQTASVLYQEAWYTELGLEGRSFLKFSSEKSVGLQEAEATRWSRGVAQVEHCVPGFYSACGLT